MSTVEAVAPRPFAAPPLARLTKVELRKMVDTRSGRWLLIASTLITLVVAVLIAILGDSGDTNLKPLLEVTWLPLSILLPVVGILAATSEWSQRTGLTTFALVPRRQRVIAAKLLATVLLGGIALVISFVSAAVGTAISGGSWALNISHIGDGFLLMQLGILSGAAFGLLLQSPALAIVVNFVLPSAFSILGTIGGLQGTWDWLDPGTTGGHLSSADAHGQQWFQLLVTSLIWIAIPTIAGIWRTMRREVK